MAEIDHAKIQEAVRLILEAVGENPDREGLQDTPKRVAKMYEEAFSGLHTDPKNILKRSLKSSMKSLCL